MKRLTIAVTIGMLVLLSGRNTEFEPIGGHYAKDKNVTIKCSALALDVYYRIDPENELSLYSDPIAVAGDGTKLTI